jgi:hypothetical protein
VAVFVRWSPPAAGRPDLSLEGRIPPVGVPGTEAYVQVSGLRVDLDLAGTADHDGAEHGEPSVGNEELVGALRSDRGLDPMP